MNSVGDHKAGAGTFGACAQTAPAQFEEDAVQLTHAGWKRVTDGMAASIVRLEHELEEANARIALLEEEQKILAKGHQGPAKAAVTEGGTANCGTERPEPSPHLQDPREALVDGHETPFTRQHVYWAVEPDGRVFLAVNANAAQRLERERDEARKALQSVMDWNPKAGYWERPETVGRFEADMARAREVLEETRPTQTTNQPQIRTKLAL